MKSLGDFVMVVDDVMPSDMCDNLVDTYDTAIHERVVRKNEIYDFTEINMFDSPTFEDFREPMATLMAGLKKFYQEKTNAFFPEQEAYEAPRIKKYEPNKGIFDWHIDAATAETGRRLLVMFWYLNDVEGGGETQFDLGDGQVISVVPKKGRVAMFPPHFMYPHKGATPISGPKYVISSYVQLPSTQAPGA